jgi:hypothetical protein
VVTYEPKSMPDYGIVDAVKGGLVPKQYAQHGYFWWKVRPIGLAVGSHTPCFSQRNDALDSAFSRAKSPLSG